MTASHTSKAVQLSLETLDQLPAPVGRPSYGRDQLSPGILHIGPGNFHRSHQAVYLDRLMNSGIGKDWAIVGASIMPGDTRLRDIMLEQDCLTTVVEQSDGKTRAHVTACMIDYLPVGDTQAILDAMESEQIRIVSMTITEGGYFLDAATGHFDTSHPAIAAEVNADSPGTVFGLLVRALRNRRDAGLPPFTVMSCDNLPHNGSIARQATVETARLIDAALADWIDANVSFPNAMVDRITPATGERELTSIVNEHGVADSAPVFCETFLQWVLEDKFCNGRPPLEQVGVQIVSDVTPFEMLKIRVLNGGHALIAYPAALLGIELADEAMANPLIRGFIDKVEHNEVIPTVPPVPDTDATDYFATVVQRFSNPAIGDTIERLCYDGSNRQPKFIVPTIAARLASGDDVTGLALGCAFWCRYCAGTDEQGQTLAPNDLAHTTLMSVALAARSRPVTWLEQHDIYGDLGTEPVFVRAFTDALNAIWEDGTQAVLTRYIAN